ncbi:MAG: GAF domain-containing protein [Acidobacteria bacterium]|nr:GAF domain-containing protein [Acidobacteriota bacterium]
MVQINFTGKEILTKIVYYGPALCGKTTNLQVLHKMTDPDRKTKLFSINTDQDRTLFFDLLPLSLGRIYGYRIKLQIYTVPGQVHYASTRRAVLAGADGVVFIADSERGKMEDNMQSFQDLATNLPYNGLDMETIPLVVQYNKRDLSDVYSYVEMEKALNSVKAPSFEAVAINGKGVLDTFVAIAKRMINNVVARYRLDRGNKGKVDFGDRLARALEEFRQRDSEDTNPVDLSRLQLKFGHPTGSKVPDLGDPQDEKIAQHGAMTNADLIERAVAANMELANLYVKLDETKRERDERIKQLEAVNRIGETVTSMLDIDRLLNTLCKILGDHAGDCICIALVEGKPPELKPRTAYRLKTDPIFLVRSEKGKSLAHLLAHQRKISIVNAETNPEWFDLVRQKFSTIEGVISIPLMSHRRLLGLVNVITTESKRGFEEHDLAFYSATSKFMASAIENARLYGMVSGLNRSLERRVSEINVLNSKLEENIQDRTQELQFANRALQRANEELKLLDKTKDQFMSLLTQELRNPMGAICNQLKDLAKAEWPSEQKSSLVDVYRNAETVNLTVSKVIRLFNLEQGKTQLSRRPVKVADLMTSALKADRASIKAKGIRILTRLDDNQTIEADASLLQEAFRHLTQNAVRYSPDSSALKIWMDTRPGKVLLYIRDQGPGIPEERRGQVFNKYQIVQGEAYMEEGLGLGLPIAKTIIERHGGAIDLLEPPPGTKDQSGLLVRITLPLAP